MKWMALGALLLLAGWFPSAQGALTMTADGPTSRIEPDGPPQNATITASMPCSEALLYGGPASPTIAVAISYASPSPHVVLSGPSEIDIDASQCLTSSEAEASGSAIYQVTGTRSAPGLVPLAVTINGTIAAHVDEALVPEKKATATMSVEMGFVALLQAKVTDKILQVPVGESATFEYALVNQGNADMTVQVLAESNPNVSVELPQPLVVPWNQDEPTMLRFKATLLTAGSYAIPLNFTAVATADPSLAAPTLKANVLLERGSCAADSDCEAKKSSPAPALLLAIVALGLAARRRA